MNSKQIYSALRSHPVTTKQFIGIYPSDQLPDTVPWPCALVVNTDPHDKPGQHWVAIYVDQDGNADYFDSYGQDINTKSILDFVKMNSTDCSVNDKQLQAPLTSVCGQYCIYFVLMRCMKRPMYYIVRLFKDRFISDAFITEFINRHFNLKTQVFEDDVVVDQLCTAFDA